MIRWGEAAATPTPRPIVLQSCGLIGWQELEDAASRELLGARANCEGTPEVDGDGADRIGCLAWVQDVA